MQFVCRYGTPDGRVLSQVREGADAATVRRDLERSGFHIFEVRPRGIPLSFDLPWRKEARRGKLPAPEFLAFNQEMVALLRAGLPLLQSMDIMLERMENPTLRSVLTEIRDDVKSGAELSEAFEKFGDLFPPLYASTLRAGEQSGELEQVIRRFIRYQRLVMSARKKVVSALVYPAALVGLSIVMLLVLAIFVMPSFRQFYVELDADLPMLTQITLGSSIWIREHLTWIVLTLVALVVGGRFWLRTEAGRETVDRWRLNLPILGSVFHGFALSEFTRALSTLLAGGIPLLSALDTAVAAVGNAWIRSRLRPTIGEVRQGQAFYAALEETDVIPSIALNMIKVGEDTGSLDDMLSSVGDYFDEKVETRMQRLLALIEPAMLVVMGIIISLLLISIYLPMFGAFSQVG